MPRKPSLSPTKITTFLACPRKYVWTYLDSRGKNYIRARSYFSFGLSLHKALQRFHDSGETGVTTLSETLTAYDESWISAGYASPEEMAEAYGEGKELLTGYIERIAAQPRLAKTISVERSLRADLGPFILTGRIDRLDEHPDGSLEIIDYKTGRSEYQLEDVRDDVAMSAYQVLVRRAYPDRRVFASLVALRFDQVLTVELSPEDHDRFVGDLLQVGETLETVGIDDYEPVLKPMCQHCDFLKLCQRHPEFKAAWDAERAQQLSQLPTLSPGP